MSKTLDTIGAAAGRQNIELVPSTHWGRGAGRFDIAAALASGESPAGPLLGAIQGERDMVMVRNMVKALFRHMAQNGRALTIADERGESPTFCDAVGDGLLALVQWRNDTGAGVRLVARSRSKRPASEGAGLAWAAIVASVARDTMGAGESLFCFDSEDGVFHPAALQVGTDGKPNFETRQERASRLRSERARVVNVRALDGLLLDRLPRVRTGKAAGPSRANRRKRARALVKVRRGVRAMLAGERLEAAASAAGFRGSVKRGAGAGGDTSAADVFIQAVKRAGFKLGVIRRGAWATVPKASAPRVDSPADCFVDEAGECVEFGERAGKVKLLDSSRQWSFLPAAPAVPCQLAAHVAAWVAWRAGQSAFVHEGGRAAAARVAWLAGVKHDRARGRARARLLAIQRGNVQRGGLLDWFAARRFQHARVCSFEPEQVAAHVNAWRAAGSPLGRRVLPAPAAPLPVVLRADGSRVRFRSRASVAGFLASARAAAAAV